MDFEKIFKEIEASNDYTVDILRQMISVDTSVPPGNNYDKMADTLEPELLRLGFETRRVTVPDNLVKQMPWNLSGDRVNLVGRKDSGRPKVSAYGHIDVVPASEGWTKDPFGGEISDGRLYGRGTTDMKGSIACFMGAMNIIDRLGLEPQFSVDCLFCTDEEIGVYPGTKYLAENGYFSNHLLWLELGVIDFPAIILGCSGAVRIEIAGKGKSCHSGSNYLGVNAVEEMVPILVELMKLKDEVQKRVSRVQAFPVPSAPSDKLTPMFNINIINAGKGVNVVPDMCRLTIDRRYLPDENYDDIVSEIETALRRGKERSKLIDLTWKIAHSYPPMEIDPDCDAMKRAKAAKKAVHGWDEYICGGISMSTDLGFVLEALKPEKVQVAQFGVDRGADIQAHTADECVYIEDLAKMTKELVYYLTAPLNS